MASFSGRLGEPSLPDPWNLQGWDVCPKRQLSGCRLTESRLFQDTRAHPDGSESHPCQIRRIGKQTSHTIRERNSLSTGGGAKVVFVARDLTEDPLL